MTQGRERWLNSHKAVEQLGIDPAAPKCRRSWVLGQLRTTTALCWRSTERHQSNAVFTFGFFFKKKEGSWPGSCPFPAHYLPQCPALQEQHSPPCSGCKWDTCCCWQVTNTSAPLPLGSWLLGGILGFQCTSHQDTEMSEGDEPLLIPPRT